ncbi:DUF805 domain-containing protein [Ferrimicrobium sp.]|uniref:DUF805 domain-containing protein n=1 Tax=Ferrimicrobium sp. TaxID=2926050 RepID=UPI0026121E92|nr:DUF805 domain-containing protein [Ferrimicrobium sp.]
MTFIQAYEQMWLNYTNFRGRANRPAYWKAVAVNLALSIVFLLVTGHSPIAGTIADLYSLAAFIPGLALTIRRLHDTNHSGWWWLICLIPIAGPITLLVFLAMRPYPAENRWGQPPSQGYAQNY